MAAAKNKVIIGRVASVEPYRNKVVDFTDLYKGSVECVKGRLKRRELVVPDGGILLRSREHSEREKEDVYFLIKWSPPKGIALAFALVYEGAMVKNSIKSRRNWKTRHFRLWRRVGANCIYEEPVLQYFKKKGASKPCGELRLCKGSCVKFQNMAVASKKGYGLHLRVCVKMETGKVPKDLDLFAYTDTEKAILQWITILKQELKLHQTCRPKIQSKSQSKSKSHSKSKSKSKSPSTRPQRPRPPATVDPSEQEALARQMQQVDISRKVDEAVDSVFDQSASVISQLSAKVTGGKPIAVELPESFVYDPRVHKGLDYTIGCAGSIRTLLRMVKEGEIMLPRETGLIAKSTTMSERLKRPVYYHMHFDDERGKDMHEAFRINTFPIPGPRASSHIGNGGSQHAALFKDRSPRDGGISNHARFGSNNSVPVGMSCTPDHVRVSSGGSRSSHNSHKSAPAFISHNHNPQFNANARRRSPPRDRLSQSTNASSNHARYGSGSSHGSAPNYKRANPHYNSIPLHSMHIGALPNPAFLAPPGPTMSVSIDFPNLDDEQQQHPSAVNNRRPSFNPHGHNPGNGSAGSGVHVRGAHAGPRPNMEPPFKAPLSHPPLPRPPVPPVNNNFAPKPPHGMPGGFPPRGMPPPMGPGARVDHLPHEQVQFTQT